MSFRNLTQGNADEWFTSRGFVKQPDGSYKKPSRRIAASEARPEGVCAVQPKPVKRRALDSRVPRKKARSIITPRRAHIEFRIFSQRPLDSDNYATKQIQDLLIHAGLLDGDEWHRLYHTVISEKVYSQDQERTEILITPFT